MSFLQNNESEYIASRITNKGRQKIAEGNFNIEYFQIGDSEFDYNFSEFDGIDNPSQKVFAPLDNDSIVKYPYKLSESVTSGTTFGNPILASDIEIIRNNIGAAGFVSQYFEYSGGTGSTIICASGSTLISASSLNGGNTLSLPGNNLSVGDFITIAFTTLIGAEGNISGSSSSLVYKIIDIGDTVTVDRNFPTLGDLGFPESATVMDNDCIITGTTIDCDANTNQQDSWILNIVWSDKPAGMDTPTAVDENLSGYTSNIYVSAKEFLGYGSSSGQSENTGTTITNSFFESIIVSPEEQHSLAIIHYSKPSTIDDEEKFYKYEDYIAHTYEEDVEYFEIYIPFIYYHRNTGSTIGAIFHMGLDDYYVNSSAIDTKRNKIKYRYLLDEQNISVGKIFVDKKIIVFDDQEIVAALDYKSNRRYTLPIPSVTQVPVGVSCGIGESELPLMSGTTGQTLYLTYLFAVTGDTLNEYNMNGIHCNYYGKIVGTDLNADASMKFNTNEFKFMKTSIYDYTSGYIANNFSVLAQLVDAGDQPTPDGWKIIDFTADIPNHTVGDYIDPINMSGSRFIITKQLYDDADRYDLEEYMGDMPDEPSTEPEFGDEQPFPGSIKLTRGTDLQVMRFLVNLPDGEFSTTQNPTWSTGKPKQITEVALLDSNKDILVIGKTPKPILRSGTQVLAVKIDF